MDGDRFVHKASHPIPENETGMIGDPKWLITMFFLSFFSWAKPLKKVHFLQLLEGQASRLY